MPFKDKEARAAYNHMYRKLNRERVDQASKLWRQKNRVRHRETTRIREKLERQLNPGKVRAADRANYNPEVHAKHWKKWADKNRHKIRENYRKWKYGLSKGAYDEMYTKQNGVCAICGHPPRGKFLDIDHNHTTEQVRELLCHSCNCVLGYAKESAEVLRKCADYIERHRS